VSGQPYGFSLRGIKHILTSWLVRAVAWSVRRMPGSWLRGLSRLIAALLVFFTPRRQVIAEQNIRQALGEGISDQRVREIRRKCVRNLTRAMLTMLRLPAMSREEIIERVSAKGWEHLEAALARGKGVLVITAHLGNWELLGARIAAQGYPVVVVARDAAHTATAGVVNLARESTGIRVIAREDVRAMLRALRANAILGILPDQHVAEGGIVADFMGRPAMTATGPANLGARTGCAVVPAFCCYDPDGSTQIEILPPLDLVDSGDREHDLITNTQLINDAIGHYIRKCPDQWLWLHRRWKVNANGADE